MEYSYKVLIPKERIGVLIGEEGTVKSFIEEGTGTKLMIQDEEVTIVSEDSFKAWITESIIKAIGRGFKPKKALNLIKEGYKLEILEISDFGSTKKDKVRLKGRVIGEEGKSRRFIEEETGCYLSVYGKTISIIGPEEWVIIARNSILMLLEGAQHNTVYNYIQKEAKKMKKMELGLI